jgi:molecular chaperone GrpE
MTDEQKPKDDPETVNGAPAVSTEADEIAAPDGDDQLAQAQAELARLKDASLRLAADFDNFRKRTVKEREDARKEGREAILQALLPVFDNLERAIQSAMCSTDVKAINDGLTLVHRQFVDSLGREGIERVATVGQPFNPFVHEAIQQIESFDCAPGTVLAEVAAGYVQGDRLVRAAAVVVAKAAST